MIKSKQDKRFEVFASVVMVIVMFIIIFPFVLLFISSITEEKTLLINGYSIFPEKLSLAAYEYIWNSRDVIFRAYATTVGVTVIGTTLHVLLVALVAYPLSLRRLPGKSVFNFLLLFTILFNGGLVPTYMVYTRIFNVSDSISGLIVPYLLMNAFSVIMTRTYINTNIADEVLEAARIDGAGEFQCLGRVVLPLCKPIIGTISLMAMIAYWNNWTNGMYFINTRRELLGIQNYLMTVMNSSEALKQQASQGLVDSSHIPSVSLRMALAVVAVIPVLVFYPFFQKSFVKGITLGSVKG